jgi:hypothetical protein
MPTLTDEQQERYSRHLLLDGWEGEGQERLLAARAEVIGSGLTARWATRYLAASGVTVAPGGMRVEAPGDDPAEGARLALEAVCAILRGR